MTIIVKDENNKLHKLSSVELSKYFERFANISRDHSNKTIIIRGSIGQGMSYSGVTMGRGI